MDAETRTALHGDDPVLATPGALPDRRELAVVAFERTRMPMVVCDARDPDTPIVLANQSFLDLTGYTADEVVGRNCRFLQGRDTCPKAIAEIAAGLAAHGDVAVELLNYRKDGSTFWNQLSITPIDDDAGRPLYYFGSQKDVTAQRRAQELEAAERRLLMEVDHRAMNALALVQSIVRLSRHDSIADYAAAVQGRVDALARAHRLLAQRRWADPEIGELVAASAAPFRDRVRAEGPPALLPAQVVQSIVLVLHEMFANAAAHGALARPGGTISIRWDQDGARTVLRWDESGSSIGGAPAERGFGLSIIDGIVARQLGGTVSLGWEASGLHAELAFPHAMGAAAEGG